MSNFLKFANLDYSDIIQQINDKLAADSRFKNTKESSVAQMLIEIFASCTDMINYYLSRQAEECFVDTAKLMSSIILLARQLGYVITRPIPANSSIKLVMKGDFNDIVDLLDNENQYIKIQIPLHETFTYNGFNFILKKTFSFTLSDVDIQNIILQGNKFVKEITIDDDGNDIEIVQGEIKEKFINGVTNPFIGQNFQTYKINDKEFSNIFGSEDFDTRITKVWVGNNKSDDNLYDIDRRSLLNWEYINDQSFDINNPKKVCYIRTAVDEDVEIVFGDNRYAKIGPVTSSDNIYIEYLSTKGSEANNSGVVDKDLVYNGKIYSINGIDITRRFTFKFNRVISGGSDLESIDSIRFGIPSNFYSLDRLVNKEDYKNYLKTLTSPIDVKNAIVWGEQEEIEFRKTISDENVRAIKELFNVVFFSCIGSLYDTTTSTYFVKTTNNGLDSALLDLDYKIDSFDKQSYFNIFVKTGVAEQLKTYVVEDYYWRLTASNNPTKKDLYFYTGQYGSEADLLITYGSDELDCYPSKDLDVTINMNFLDLENTVYEDLMDEIASKIQTELRTIIDTRGNNKYNNDNYGSLAFQNIVCYYDRTNNVFKINSDVNDKCYVKDVKPVITLENSLCNVIGFGENILSRINISSNDSIEISNKITSVIDKLDQRGQVTVKHVYVSPIIQNFEIVGNVYINSMYDLLTMKTSIENDIYSWLDLNVDFNVPIYISNIIEKIESYSGVKYSDVKLQPKLNDNTIQYYDFNTGDSLGILSNNSDFVTCLSIINSEIWDFILTNNFSDINSSSVSAYNVIVQSYDYKLINNINERNFCTMLMKNIYDRFIDNNIVITDTDFMQVMSCIHKDLSNIIRYNMLDSKGNISREFSNNMYRGGYSLGNEIVKIECKMNYLYR